jgi:hypothetical protein
LVSRGGGLPAKIPVKVIDPELGVVSKRGRPSGVGVMM